MTYILILIATVASGEITLPLNAKFTTEAACLEQIEVVRPHMGHIFSQLLPANSYRNPRVECVEDKSGEPA